MTELFKFVKIDDTYIFDGICRMCAIFSQESSIFTSIFNHDQTTEFQITYYIKILNLEISENDGLPQKICKNCLDQLINFDNFRKKCTKAQITLKKNLENITTDPIDFDNAKSSLLFAVENIANSKSFLSLGALINDIKDEAESIHNFQEHIVDKDAFDSDDEPLINKVLSVSKSKESEILENGIQSIVIQNNNQNIDEEPIILQCAKCEKYILESELKQHLSNNCNNIKVLSKNLTEVVTKSCEESKKKRKSSRNTVGKKRIKENDNSLEKDIKVEKEIKEEPGNSTEMSESKSGCPDIDDDDNNHNENESTISKCTKCRKYVDTKQLKNHVSRNCYYLLLSSDKKNIDDEKFCCSNCDYEFDTKSQIVKHIKKYHPIDNPYSCIECNKFYGKLSNLNVHLKSRHSKNIVLPSQRCRICEITFDTKKLYMKHRTEKHSNPDLTNLILQCKTCNKKYKNEKLLFEHETIHTGERPYVCDECGKSFRFKKSLAHHIKIHKNSEPFSCSTCARGFETQNELIKHRREHYKNKVIEFQCEYCGQIFSCLSNLKFHVGRKHKSANPNPDSFYKLKNECIFKCPLCPSKFILPSALKKHMTVHDETRKHPCAECNCSFKSAAHLRRHYKRLHSTAHPFPCRFCNKSFKDTEVRRWHERLHKNEEHKCQYCGRVFKLKEYLARHQRLHTGEKPYACFLCGLAFSDTQALGKHFTRKHTTEESEQLKAKMLATFENIKDQNDLQLNSEN